MLLALNSKTRVKILVIYKLGLFYFFTESTNGLEMASTVTAGIFLFFACCEFPDFVVTHFPMVSPVLIRCQVS